MLQRKRNVKNKKSKLAVYGKGWLHWDKSKPQEEIKKKVEKIKKLKK